LQYSYHNSDWIYTIGLIYGANTGLNSTDKLEFTHNEITSSLEQDEQGAITIPEKFGIGFSVNKKNNFRVGFDYKWNKWSNITFANPNIDVKNSNRYSIGVEYTPGKKEKMSKRVSYRLGANYKNSFLEIGNTQINSMAINLGLGIPYNAKDNINFSMEYGEEGTLKNALVKSNYLMFYLNFSLHEFWTKRQY
jgi:long-subunit fatty acid transport protein